MGHKITIPWPEQIVTEETHLRFFTETIEVGRISPLAFLEAGQARYSDEHFYWQNANQTLTIVGLGHAQVLESHCVEEHFSDIKKRWEEICSGLIKEEKDKAPVLFGGFSFDPKNTRESEWSKFPNAYFVLPSFQLMTKNGHTFILINLVTTNHHAAEEFEKLRVERDQLIHKAQLNDFIPASKPTVESLDEIEKERYKKAVQNVTSQIQNGEADKVVVARSVKLNFKEPVSGVTALHHIANEQQESYHFGLQKGEQLFFGATPERLIEIENGQAYSACVAGSIKRGETAEEDRILGEELLSDRKNRDEHQYVVDMISTVFDEFCTNVSIPKEPKLMKIRDIQHLFTPVEASVDKEKSIFEFVQALHPTPALGGVPTNKSMDMIREEEQMDRGYYAAPIGWTDTEGNGEFAVAIRSALLEEEQAYLYAGGGIVANSEVEKEYEETWIKFRPVLRALGGQLHDK
ncbi:isochorismate synthase [Sporosarcina ureilytica]|uniref:isochorismate synthase n=1 Tax=Sporosarcina ureilytica TaxID=298596 RepID=A0A1D8JE85_9BACL|nr:isochorismate synthase [Sporosarcina ureilytica]AOV07025.1 isochorismate synthase [Sporosarcina ureilytica]